MKRTNRRGPWVIGAALVSAAAAVVRDGVRRPRAGRRHSRHDDHALRRHSRRHGNVARRGSERRERAAGHDGERRERAV